MMSRSTLRLNALSLFKALADIVDCRVREPPDNNPAPDDNINDPMSKNDNADARQSLLKLLSSLGKYPWPH